jgi:hypothetical protein
MFDRRPERPRARTCRRFRLQRCRPDIDYVRAWAALWCRLCPVNVAFQVRGLGCGLGERDAQFRLIFRSAARQFPCGDSGLGLVVGVRALIPFPRRRHDSDVGWDRETYRQALSNHASALDAIVGDRHGVSHAARPSLSLRRYDLRPRRRPAHPPSAPLPPESQTAHPVGASSCPTHRNTRHSGQRTPSGRRHLATPRTSPSIPAAEQLRRVRCSSCQVLQWSPPWPCSLSA